MKSVEASTELADGSCLLTHNLTCLTNTSHELNPDTRRARMQATVSVCGAGTRAHVCKVERGGKEGGGGGGDWWTGGHAGERHRGRGEEGAGDLLTRTITTGRFCTSRLLSRKHLPL
jgi:hypothetical protein